MKQKGTTMCDDKTKAKKIKKWYENQHHTRMQNTSWHMPREARQELEEELYQKAVDESSESFMEYLMICYW